MLNAAAQPAQSEPAEAPEQAAQPAQSKPAEVPEQAAQAAAPSEHAQPTVSAVPHCTDATAQPLQQAESIAGFVLGFLTDTMADNAVKYVHERLLLADATFGTNQQKLSLYTALCMDTHGNGMPVYHVLIHSCNQDQLEQSDRAWQAHMESKHPRFRPGCAMIYDATAEINAKKYVCFL